MKTTASLMSISALAVVFLMPTATYADDDQLSEREAQEYARDLLKPEEKRAGLDNIREEPSEEYLDEKGYKGDTIIEDREPALEEVP